MFSLITNMIILSSLISIVRDCKILHDGNYPYNFMLMFLVSRLKDSNFIYNTMLLDVCFLMF